MFDYDQHSIEALIHERIRFLSKLDFTLIRTDDTLLSLPVESIRFLSNLSFTLIRTDAILLFFLFFFSLFVLVEWKDFIKTNTKQTTNNAVISLTNQEKKLKYSKFTSNLELS